MFLLDTDTVIFLLHGNSSVAARLNEHPPEAKKISVITYAELIYGAHRSARVASNLSETKHLAEAFEMLDVSKAVAEIFAEARATLDSRGERIPDADLLIAATAMAHGLTLVTNNTKHFRRIRGLQLDNWTV